MFWKNKSFRLYGPIIAVALAILFLEAIILALAIYFALPIVIVIAAIPMYLLEKRAGDILISHAIPSELNKLVDSPNLLAIVAAGIALVLVIALFYAAVDVIILSGGIGVLVLGGMSIIQQILTLVLSIILTIILGLGYYASADSQLNSYYETLEKVPKPTVLSLSDSHDPNSGGVPLEQQKAGLSSQNSARRSPESLVSADQDTLGSGIQ